MVWIRVDTALTRHPKVIKFASAINASRHEAIGLLVDLWTWSIDYAEDGDLTKYTSAELLTALGAFQTSALIEIDLLEALETAGFVDRDGDRVYLHDWDAHQGQLIAQREAGRDRQKKYRRRKKDVTEDVTVTSSVTNAPTNERNETITNKPTEMRTPDTKVLEFENLEPVTLEMADRWRDLFPGVRLDIEFEAMLVYLNSAPPSKRPKASLPKFALNWIKRSAAQIGTEEKIDKRERNRRAQRAQELAEAMADLARTKMVTPKVLQESKDKMSKVFSHGRFDKRAWEKERRAAQEAKDIGVE
tara:strand:+ start:1053 stop:1961 length:909 start_codon:yes stop_codon:yes gene_type:complete